jgi:ATP-dependent helicase IRC3
VKANIDMKGVTINSHSGDFSPTSLAHVINTETLNKLVVQTWLDRAGESIQSSPLAMLNVRGILYS